MPELPTPSLAIIFVAKTMSKAQLAAAYGVTRSARLKEWCERAGVDWPPDVHLLSAEMVRRIVKGLGAPRYDLTADQM